MRALTRFFAILAVALVAAQPVMACCLAGHGAVAQKVAQVSDPPCHDSGMQMAPADKAGAAQDTDDCPGCYDCDSPLMQAQEAEDSTLLSSSSAEIPYAMLAVQFPRFAHQPVIFKTGPPGAPQLPLSTPITLKQRLLI